MRLPVYVQGLTRDLKPIDSCDEVYLGLKSRDELVEEVLAKVAGMSLHPGYNDWDGGITIIVTRDDKYIANITYNGPNSFLVMEDTGEELIERGDSMTLDMVIEYLDDFYKSPAHKG